LVVNSVNKRFDETIKKALIFYEKIFGEDFFKNLIVVFTNWAQNKNAKNSRKNAGINEEVKSNEFNSKLKLLFPYI